MSFDLLLGVYPKEVLHLSQDAQVAVLLIANKKMGSSIISNRGLVMVQFYCGILCNH